MIGTKQSMKLVVLTSMVAAVMGLTACQKKSEKAPETKVDTDVPMSAEPAENNDPVIVADDLDDVDARSASLEQEDINKAQGQSDDAMDDPEQDTQQPDLNDTQPATKESVPN
ncbi:hypothetical protein [Psychrobacter sp.]|uniref:hypothetical protein n=1 Tax=Psychrobacter sp. TaxID=56811 RepID=UPI0025D6D408|nr:hypothetical protein [Psychrobacter sp.]